MFFEKVKARLRNKDTYQDFLKCLNLFSQEIIGRTELHSLVSFRSRSLCHGSPVRSPFPDLDSLNCILITNYWTVWIASWLPNIASVLLREGLTENQLRSAEQTTYELASGAESIYQCFANRYEA